MLDGSCELGKIARSFVCYFKLEKLRRYNSALLHIVQIVPSPVRNIVTLIAVPVHTHKIPRFRNNFGSRAAVQVGVTFAVGKGKTGEAQLTFKISAVDGGIVHMKMAVQTNTIYIGGVVPIIIIIDSIIKICLAIIKMVEGVTIGYE